MGVGFGHLVGEWRTSNRPFALAALDRRAYLKVDRTALGLRRAALFLTQLFTSYRRSNCLFVSGLPRYDSMSQLVTFHAPRLAPLAQGYALHWVNGFLTNMGALVRNFWGHTVSSSMRFKQRVRRVWFNESVRGLVPLQRFPDVVCFLSVAGVYEVALREARALHLPIVAFVDSDVEVAGISYSIPSDDDSRTGTHMKILFFRELLLRAFKQTLYGELYALQAFRSELSSVVFRASVDDYLKEITTSSELAPASGTAVRPRSVSQDQDVRAYRGRGRRGWLMWSTFRTWFERSTSRHCSALRACLATKPPLPVSHQRCSRSRWGARRAVWDPEWLQCSGFVLLGLGVCFRNRWPLRGEAGWAALVVGWYKRVWSSHSLCFPVRFCLTGVGGGRGVGSLGARVHWRVRRYLFLQSRPQLGLVWWGRHTLTSLPKIFQCARALGWEKWWRGRVGWRLCRIMAHSLELNLSPFYVSARLVSRPNVVAVSAAPLSRPTLRALEVSGQGQLMPACLYRHKLYRLAQRLARRRARVLARRTRVRFQHFQTSYHLRGNPGLFSLLLQRWRPRRRYGSTTVAAHLISLVPFLLREAYAAQRKKFRVHPLLFRRYFRRLLIRRFLITLFPVMVTEIQSDSSHLESVFSLFSVSVSKMQSSSYPLSSLRYITKKVRVVFYRYIKGLLHYRFLTRLLLILRDGSFSLSFLCMRLRKIEPRLYRMYRSCLAQITRVGVCGIRLLMRPHLFAPRRFLSSFSFWLVWLRAALRTYGFYPRLQQRQEVRRPIFSSWVSSSLLEGPHQRARCQLQPVQELLLERFVQFTGARASNFTRWFSRLGRALRGRFSQLRRKAILNSSGNVPSSLSRISYALASALPTLYSYRSMSHRRTSLYPFPSLYGKQSHVVQSRSDFRSSFFSFLYLHREWRKARRTLFRRVGRYSFGLVPNVQSTVRLLRVFA